ncbi:MAG TPA: TonB family protein [Thermoanaerobaculia bacterium]|nr:TonB family protein [Thermoanaerobaculia bacterium]
MRTAIALLLLAACAREAPQATPVRTPVAVEYVRGDTLEIHAAPSDSAPVIARYADGESVSVLSRRGEWSEVRTVDGSGWARASGLATAAESKTTESDNVTPRFRKAPAPVTEPGAHGEIRLEANVNSDGEVLDVKVERNTTGSPSLLAKNIAALQRARFVPIVQHGKRTPFVYEYHVGY